MNKQQQNIKQGIFGHASLKTTEKYIKAVPPGTLVNGSLWDFMDKKDIERMIRWSVYGQR